MSSPRNFTPRPPVVVRPSFVSQENAFAILGVTARKFLDCVVPKCESVSRLGKTALVPIDEVERVVRSLAETSTEPHAESSATRDDDQPETAEDVLRELGRCRT